MKLVTGGSGQLGTALSRLWPDAFYPSSSELDLARPDDLFEQVAKWKPALIVNCAAYTQVDHAEHHEATAFAVNGVAVGELARYAHEHGVPFVTFSTDYVFAGNGTRPYVESDPTAPINAYGRTKLEGELRALQYPTSLVIRTSWVISGTHGNFVETMLRLVPDRELRVVNDQSGCPTIADDLAAATIRSLDARVTGILHMVNPPATTWFGLARKAVELAGFDPERISPCTTAEYPLPAPRPAYSVLGSERLDPLGVAPLPSWHESLGPVVAALLRRSQR